MNLAKLAAIFAAMLFLAAPARAAETYKVDPVHSMAVFRIGHFNLGHVWGRFNDPQGQFTLDDDPAKSSFQVQIAVEKIDTANAQRDTHLKSPDFFNAAQFPQITFKSTSIKNAEGNTWQVTGDLTLHGVTKPVTAKVEKLGSGNTPMGYRAGIEATLTLKRSDFGMTFMIPAAGDEVRLHVALEGVKQ